ncbi:MAG: DNA cytosine methyltransferase [Saprospiraceae bacterium]|nr:DNA cytosine methyltransferase [Saprospiraceae bacterium]MCB9325872.1 DNA cytosine methyltransferase [Lewinellaceae bacterium]
MDYTEKHNEQRILSLCTGSRGIEKGIEKVIPGLRTVTYVEIEAFIIFNLVAEMEAGLVDSAPIWSNLKTFDPKPYYGKIHGITAGYPCQPFSQAGKRLGKDDPRHLWPNIREVIRTVRPLWAFFENVEGHLSMGFKEVHQSLRDLGYTVEAGAPHQRKRLFILACSDVNELRRCMADTCYEYGSISKKPWNRNNKTTASKCRKNVEYSNSSEKQGIGIRNEKELAYNRSAGINVADTMRIGGREGMERRESRQFNKNGSEWPAKPGQRQFEWEEKRTVKSGLGCTVNGYNFRTDLLRMYGNGVVEQVAEKAFYQLLVKQIENFDKLKT